MEEGGEIPTKSSTITKAIIGCLALILIVLSLLYIVATNHGNALQTNVSNLQSENNNLKTQLTLDNNTIASLSSSLNNTQCTPSTTLAAVPNNLNTAVTPLVVFDSQANPSITLISVGNGTESGGHGNLISQQIEKQNGISPTPNSNIVQAYGSTRILIAGYSANGTVQAGEQFVQDLFTIASNNNGSLAGISFQNIPIINNAGQPVVQIVIGSDSLPSDGIVAANIAAAIGSLAHTYSNVTCIVSH